MSDALQRKLTTIVATDVAEYARLVDEDEESTLRALQDCRRTLFQPLIEKHGGRLANTAGDSMLIEFGSTLEAVRFAIELQAQLGEYNARLPSERQIWLRIGINVGDVISEGPDLLGDGVNVAARLENLADTGGIYVSRTVRDQVRDRIPLRFEDLGKIRVRHIARPVHVFKIAGMESHPGNRARRPAAKYLALMLGMAALLILGIGSFWLGKQADFEPADPQNLAYRLPAKPSIAVLPFSNLSGDPGQDFLAVSFSEDVLTSLSELSGLFVISGSTTSKLGDPEYTPKRVAEELGIRYVIRGNLQRDGDRLRISAMLVDTFDGQVLWSDRYDREMTDLFELKDEITLEIIANIGAQLELGERDKIRGRETRSLEAWLLQREGYRTVQKFNAEDNAIGRRLLEQALEIDPEFATVYANLGFSYRLDYQMGWVKDRDAADRKSFEFSTRALEIDPEHGPATANLASWYLVKGDADQAVEIAARAVLLEPADYLVHAVYGMTLIHSGNPERAINELKLSLRLSPIGPDWVMFKLAEAHLTDGDAAEAAAVAKELLQRPPSSPSTRNLTHIMHALALNELGQTEEARHEVARAIEAFPKRNLELWTRQRPYADAQLQKRWSDTLRSLGMP